RLAAAERFAAERARVERARVAVHDLLLVDAGAIGARGPDGAWDFAAPLPELLDRARFAPALTPWRRPTDWAYARRLVPELTFATLAVWAAGARLDRLATLVRKGRRAPAYLLVDAWGTRVRIAGDVVTSAGPDRRFDTADDIERGGLVGYGYGSIGYGSGSGT